jgi:hypothetical protein
MTRTRKSSSHPRCRVEAACSRANIMHTHDDRTDDKTTVRNSNERNRKKAGHRECRRLFVHVTCVTPRTTWGISSCSSNFEESIVETSVVDDGGGRGLGMATRTETCILLGGALSSARSECGFGVTACLRSEDRERIEKREGRRDSRRSWVMRRMECSPDERSRGDVCGFSGVLESSCAATGC